MRKDWVKSRTGNVTQMHHARKGVITEEMQHVARLEHLEPEFVCSEIAEGRLIIPANIHEVIEKLKPSWGERMVDWCLTHSTRKDAIIIILSCLNTPGLIWRLRFILETAFPGPMYLKHYFGPAPGNLWPLLYLRRFNRFLHG